MDSNSQQTWIQARNFANIFGSYTPAFTSTIRTLLHDSTKQKEGSAIQLSDPNQFMLMRLVRCPSILSHLYYAAKTVHEERFQEMGKVTPEAIVRTFSSYELACILGVIYASRRMSQRCPPEQWKIIAESMQQYVDLGTILGASIPGIGLCYGLLAGASRFLAWGTFAIRDAEKFRKYRINLKSKKKPCDWDCELHDWGTTHVHVASVMITSLGFGKEFANAYFMGSSDIATSFLNEEALRFRVASLWLDSLIYRREPPKDTFADDYALDESLAGQFTDKVADILDGDSKYCWLLRTKNDIGPDVTPELIMDLNSFGKTEEAEPTDSLNYDDLDEQIRQNFSQAELADIMSEVQTLVEDK